MVPEASFIIFKILQLRQMVRHATAVWSFFYIHQVLSVEKKTTLAYA